jgi:Ser/Thr protein kinase RdoA (MazF antagonist)
MDTGVLNKILQKYGITNARLLHIEKGYRNQSHHVITSTGMHLNFILYKGEQGMVERIRRAHQVANQVAQSGLPARKTYQKDRILQVTRSRYGALYEYLPGTTIPWEAYTQHHLKLLGKTMSDMHASIRHMPPIASNGVAHEYTVICQQIQRYLTSPGVQQALRKKLGLAFNMDALPRYIRLLQNCQTIPGQQLHMDFVRGNILFETATTLRLTGILDFEKTAHGTPLFDVARTLAFLLVDCKYKTPAQIYKYFIVSGYNKRGSASGKVNPHSEALLQRLVDLFLIHDFYKFLCHNPYESLPDNEHYVRTTQLLLQRRLVASCAT